MTCVVIMIFAAVFFSRPTTSPLLPSPLSGFTFAALLAAALGLLIVWRIERRGAEDQAARAELQAETRTACAQLQQTTLARIEDEFTSMRADLDARDGRLCLQIARTAAASARMADRLNALEMPTLQLRTVAVGTASVAAGGSYAQGYVAGLAAQTDAKVLPFVTGGGAPTPRP